MTMVVERGERRSQKEQTKQGGRGRDNNVRDHVVTMAKRVCKPRSWVHGLLPVPQVGAETWQVACLELIRVLT
jgi:hypothetical protein